MIKSKYRTAFNSYFYRQYTGMVMFYSFSFAKIFSLSTNIIFSLLTNLFESIGTNLFESRAFAELFFSQEWRHMRRKNTIAISLTY